MEARLSSVRSLRVSAPNSTCWIIPADKSCPSNNTFGFKDSDNSVIDDLKGFISDSTNFGDHAKDSTFPKKKILPVALRHEGMACGRSVGGGVTRCRPTDQPSPAQPPAGG